MTIRRAISAGTGAANAATTSVGLRARRWPRGRERVGASGARRFRPGDAGARNRSARPRASRIASDASARAPRAPARRRESHGLDHLPSRVARRRIPRASLGRARRRERRQDDFSPLPLTRELISTAPERPDARLVPTRARSEPRRIVRRPHPQPSERFYVDPCDTRPQSLWHPCSHGASPRTFRPSPEDHGATPGRARAHPFETLSSPPEMLSSPRGSGPPPRRAGHLRAVLREPLAVPSRHPSSASPPRALVGLIRRRPGLFQRAFAASMSQEPFVHRGRRDIHAPAARSPPSWRCPRPRTTFAERPRPSRRAARLDPGRRSRCVRSVRAGWQSHGPLHHHGRGIGANAGSTSHPGLPVLKLRRAKKSAASFPCASAPLCLCAIPNRTQRPFILDVRRTKT